MISFLNKIPGIEVDCKLKAFSDSVRATIKPVIDVLAEIESIQGIVCFGSYAMGTFDELSDIDLYVFCHPQITPSQVRGDAFRRIDGISNIEIDHAEFEWNNQWHPKGDRFRVRGTLYDMTYNTAEWMRTVVNKVTEQGSTSIDELRLRPYTMLGLLKNSVILHDPEFVLQELKAKLYPYPAKLRQHLLAQGRSTLADSLADLNDFVERGVGNTAFHFHLGRILDALGTTLFALNEHYDPATKRVEEAYRELSIVPPDFLQRYDRILQTPLTNEGRKHIVEELGLLIGELKNLIDEAQ